MKIFTSRSRIISASSFYDSERINIYNAKKYTHIAPLYTYTFTFHIHISTYLKSE